MDINKISSLVIRWGFIFLFFSVPLFFSASTSELFEYNKMMLTYGITIVIVAAWICKMLSAGKFIYKRTFLEIPLLLYIASHILSTVFSIDPHMSIWGYYSRFHEGLLASISYVLLYFAAVSNLTKDDVKKIFYSSFISAAIVAVWGTMEHFGNSPSCLLITGKGGVDCWIQDVKSRVYATLGQPNWMAAYMDIIILMALAFITKVKTSWKYVGLITLSFAALLFTKSRSGLLGLGLGLGVYALYNLKHLKNYIFVIVGFTFVALLFGLPFAQTENLSVENILNKKTPAEIAQQKAAANNPDINISESGDIRKVVWTGAIKIWQRYPIFGSGVETFGYAYYKDRPVEHNMLSEWDFLYNKAHNEYLNLLATTGTVGIVAYALIILTFGKFLISNYKNLNNFQVVLAAAYVSILATNFFGFSVVIIGIYFFLIPAFCFLLNENS